MKMICFINLFTAKAKAYSVNDDNDQTFLSEITVEDAAEQLADLCHFTGLHHLILIGAPTYSDALVPDILAYSKIKYSNNDLTVEVMR